jgi:hypothetical protein
LAADSFLTPCGKRQEFRSSTKRRWFFFSLYQVKHLPENCKGISNGRRKSTPQKRACSSSRLFAPKENIQHPSSRKAPNTKRIKRGAREKIGGLSILVLFRLQELIKN